MARAATPPIMNPDECLARAMELEARMAEAPPGLVRDEYGQLAAQWRILADIATYESTRTSGE